MNKLYLAGLPALLLAGMMISCSDDDNPAGGNEGAHMDAVGVALVMDGDTLVKAEGQAITGELELHVGESLGPVLAHSLDDEGLWYRPEFVPDGAHELALSWNGLVCAATINQENWEFTLEGLEEAETALRVRILHEGHDDYVSPELPLHIYLSDAAHGGHSHFTSPEVHVDVE